MSDDNCNEECQTSIGVAAGVAGLMIVVFFLLLWHKRRSEPLCDWKAFFVDYIKNWNVLVGIFTSTVGCYGFYYGLGFGQSSGEFEIVMITISFYMVLFGVLNTAAECKIINTYKKFGLLASRGGRGVFMFFIGSLALVLGIDFSRGDNEVYWIAIAGAWCMYIGFLLMMTYCLVSSGDAGLYWDPTSQSAPPSGNILSGDSSRLDQRLNPNGEETGASFQQY